jgi:hypothetical protein
VWIPPAGSQFLELGYLLMIDIAVCLTHINSIPEFSQMRHVAQDATTGTD